MTAPSVEQRLATLEAEVARLRRLVKDEGPWWKQWVGAFENDPYFERAMKYGRQYRESQRPKSTRKRKRPNGGA